MQGLCEDCFSLPQTTCRNEFLGPIRIGRDVQGIGPCPEKVIPCVHSTLYSERGQCTSLCPAAASRLTSHAISSILPPEGGEEFQRRFSSFPSSSPPRIKRLQQRLGRWSVVYQPRSMPSKPRRPHLKRVGNRNLTQGSYRLERRHVSNMLSLLSLDSGWGL